MPCPYFEPLAVVAGSFPRLPLLDEYSGRCHAGGQPVPAPEEFRLRCCNHGNSRGTCCRFPEGETRSAIRFDVTSATVDVLELLYLEEQDHAPLRWQTLRYLRATDSLEPPVADPCQRAQAKAFSRSFLQRYRAELVKQAAS